jgi:hypothetical protein
VRAARRAARAGLEEEVERSRVAVERRIRSGAEAAAARVVPTAVEREDVLVEAHEHVRGGREDVRFAETGAEAVVGGLRLEDAHRRALAELGQVPAQLQLRWDRSRRSGRRGEERDTDDDERPQREKSAHRGRL